MLDYLGPPDLVEIMKHVVFRLPHVQVMQINFVPREAAVAEAENLSCCLGIIVFPSSVIRVVESHYDAV